ncbi:MAG: type II toxin-antitoxin system VapC family toxin, partial [Candidatus Acidiferrum sp.]
VWWGSLIEVHSAIARLHRQGQLSNPERAGALARLGVLSRGWKEILPDDALREHAGELLDRYALRSADSLQLAAALTWCREHPSKRIFVCGDKRLCEAAESAGFSLFELSRAAP